MYSTIFINCITLTAYISRIVNIHMYMSYDHVICKSRDELHT